MESQLRGGAAFCRRVAALALLLGFAGSMAVGFALERGSADGLGLPALLAIMGLSVLAVLLFCCLFLMLARVMEGLADLVALVERLSDAMAALDTTRWEPPPARAGEGHGDERAGTGDSEGGVSPPTAAPGPAGDVEPSSPIASSRPDSLAGAVETIRLGGFVKVTTPAGWTGWVRDTDLPPIDPNALPRTPAGIPYRPPMPSLSPGKPPR